MKLVAKIENGACISYSYDVQYNKNTVKLNQIGTKNSFILSNKDFEDYKLISDFILCNVNSSNKAQTLFSKLKKKLDFDESYASEIQLIDDYLLTDDNFKRRGIRSEIDVRKLSYNKAEIIDYNILLKCKNLDLHFPVFVTERKNGKLVLEKGYEILLFALLKNVTKINCLIIKL
jgi:hypothetical protein